MQSPLKQNAYPHLNYEWFLRSVPVFKNLRFYYYESLFSIYNVNPLNPRKCIPPDLHRIFCFDLSLAIWVCDDFSQHKSVGVNQVTGAFSVGSLTEKEQSDLQKILVTNFDFISKVIGQNTQIWIWILKDLLFPHLAEQGEGIVPNSKLRENYGLFWEKRVDLILPTLNYKWIFPWYVNDPTIQARIQHMSTEIRKLRVTFADRFNPYPSWYKNNSVVNISTLFFSSFQLLTFLEFLNSYNFFPNTKQLCSTIQLNCWWTVAGLCVV